MTTPPTMQGLRPGSSGGRPHSSGSSSGGRPKSTFEEYTDAHLKENNDHWKRQAAPKTPNFKLCYICGRQFGTSSLAIHQPVCMRKWELEQSKLPPDQRRPMPKPEEFQAIVTKSGKTELEAFNDAAETTFNQGLSPCPNCGRTFLPDRLQVHLRSCKEPKEPREPRPVSRARLPVKTPSADSASDGSSVKAPQKPVVAAASSQKSPVRPAVLAPIKVASDSPGNLGSASRSKTPEGRNGSVAGALRKAQDHESQGQDVPRPRSAQAGGNGFCVECDVPYPTSSAKFCMDCGSKRPGLQP